MTALTPLRAFGLLAGLTILLSWAQQLTGSEWDWDINHMMYFGQRLLAGEFHWTVEFDDKLPINQIIFALPAAFGSFRVWQIMSILSCIGGAVAVRWLILYIMQSRDDLPVETRRIAGWTGAWATLIGFSFAPGGIHHINPMAASAAIGSIALLACAMAANRINIAVFILAAALASIAIGMRPYLALAVCITPLWLCLRAGRGLPYALGVTALWIGAITVFGTLTNLLPYVVLGEMQAFENGLHVLGQTLTPGTLKGIIYSQAKAFLFQGAPVVVLIFLSAVATAALALGKARHSGYWRDVLVLGALMPILIEVMVLAKHFWPHYTQMFMPFLALGAGVLMGELRTNPQRSAAQSAGTMISTAVLLLAAFGAGAGLWANRGATKHMDLIGQEFARYLDTRPANARDFLIPERMYIHWFLQEPRHGFPHAANSHHIAQGWLEQVSAHVGTGLPTNTESYCSKLNEDGPSLVMSMYIASIRECLAASSVYARVDWPMPQSHDMDGFVLFERHTSAQHKTALFKE